MKKFVKCTCGIMLIAALLGSDIDWPLPVVSAEGAETLSGQQGEEDLAAEENRGAEGKSSASGEAAPGEGSSFGEIGFEGAGGSPSEETKPEGAGGSESGEPASGEDSGSTSGESQPAGDSGSTSGESQPAGDSGSASGESQPAGDNGSASGESQPAGDSKSALEESLSAEEEGAATEPQGTLRRTSGAMEEETAQWIEEAGENLAQIAAERDIMALVYLSDEYPVRSLPSLESDVAVTVLSGQMVNILDVYVDDDIDIWYYVNLEYQGRTLYGYVQRVNLACSDTRFLEWEEQYGMNFNASVYTVDGKANSSYPDIEQFPESYRPALLELKKKHPTWTFVKMNTTLDWQTAIENELKDGRSLVYKTLPDWAKTGLYDTGNWYYASEAALKLYMDPRNALTENAVFQFEQLTYNEKYHTLEAVSKFLQSTFMSDGKNAPGTSSTYSNLFWTTGRDEKVSPFHLAARVLQEQGSGTSPLVSGTYAGYEGYYNYFNIGATGKTNQQVITSGLKYAKEHGWTNAELAIKGGAVFISANYIKKGQDTLYLQKFNVNPNGAYKPYTHQYMQNITAPTTEGQSIKRLYEGAGALDNTFVFKIPVYENMPGEACGVPSVSTDVTLAMPEGYTDTTMWLDGVAYQGTLQNGSLTVKAPDGNAHIAVLYQYNESGVPVGMSVWSLSYNGVVYTATQQSGLKDLLTYHGFSIRITGKTGIRFKTGISTDLRSKLLSQGVDGYTLKEYGTLVTNNANLGQYPMVKGGAKISGGVSYGKDSSGKLQDVVFEIVDNRIRYTSVLVGLPVEQYKTEFAFRGYAVLEKGGVQTIVYGPVVAKSIYSLSQQLLDQKLYPAGSETDAFLKKIISDADALAAKQGGQ